MASGESQIDGVKRIIDSGLDESALLLTDSLLGQKGYGMPDPTHEQLIHDVEQIVLDLEPDSDFREWPDNHRRGTFLAGWRDATERGKDYQSRVLEE